MPQTWDIDTMIGGRQTSRMTPGFEEYIPKCVVLFRDYYYYHRLLLLFQ